MKTRSPIQCLHRWTKILKPGLVKGPWTIEEDEQLMEWIEINGPKKWSYCSKRILGRSGKQCRERWYNTLNPEVKKGNWSIEEDYKIFFMYKKYGSKWCQIFLYFKGRTENAIKNRFYSFLRKKYSDNIKEIMPKKKHKKSLNIIEEKDELKISQKKEYLIDNEINGNNIDNDEMFIGKKTKRKIIFSSISDKNINKNDKNITINEHEDLNSDSNSNKEISNNENSNKEISNNDYIENLKNININIGNIGQEELINFFDSALKEKEINYQNYKKTPFFIKEKYENYLHLENLIEREFIIEDIEIKLQKKIKINEINQNKQQDSNNSNEKKEKKIKEKKIPNNENKKYSRKKISKIINDKKNNNEEININLNKNFVNKFNNISSNNLDKNFVNNFNNISSNIINENFENNFNKILTNNFNKIISNDFNKIISNNLNLNINEIKNFSMNDFYFFLDFSINFFNDVNKFQEKLSKMKFIIYEFINDLQNFLSVILNQKKNTQKFDKDIVNDKENNSNNFSIDINDKNII
jgi:hypothetical protein